MNLLAVIFTLLAGFFLLRLPRAWAPSPLLIGVSYIAAGECFEVGPLHFTVIRILVTVGALRVLTNRERIVGGWNSIDWLMVLFGLWAICSSAFHKDHAAALINRLGLAYDSLGLYFLLRTFINGTENMVILSRAVIIALLPVALEMMSEALTGMNSFSFLGGVPPESEVRDGKVRAQGPFAHSILAGTVGAVCFPMAALVWKSNRRLALVGLAAAGSMVICSKSSTPILTAGFALLGLALWKVRDHMRLVRWSALLGIIALDIIMKAPVYYLIARVDLTGSSTSYYRAALIESAFYHIDEWWLGGTDRTRHWMPTGAAWNEDHADITNHYIKIGVVGGLPLMLVFICILTRGFNCAGRALRLKQGKPHEQGVIWILGSILFAHAATMISVSYFDQSVVFLYLVLAGIGSVYSTTLAEKRLIHRTEHTDLERESQTAFHYG